jgi:predicted NUDIX family NTP pyrophosphohydrolase
MKIPPVTNKLKEPQEGLWSIPKGISTVDDEQHAGVAPPQGHHH